MNTEQLAALLHLQAKTIRRRFNQTGSYYGLRPTKLPNRFLIWPADSIERLSGGAK